MATHLFADTEYTLHGFWGQCFSYGAFQKHIVRELDEVLALALLYLLRCASFSYVVVGPWVLPYLVNRWIGFVVPV